MNLVTLAVIACLASAAFGDQSSSDSRTLDTLWKGNTPASCAAYAAKATCTAAQLTSKFPSFDGSCHSINNIRSGMAGTPLKRFLPPAYANGIDLPRSKSVTGADLPNPRTISASFMTENKQEEAIWTHIFTTFGQFLTHDLAETALVSNGGSKPSCPCGSTDTHTCSSFSLPSTTSGRPAVTTSDVLGTCLQFVRSAGSFPDLSNCQRTYREQVNLINSFIDASPVYGNSEAEAKALRTLSGGQLINTIATNNLIYLPNTTDTCGTHLCFKSGDPRTTENLGLTGIHMVFLREHNRIARGLAALKPTWDDETLYQETRRIMIAVLQHIVYDQFVPSVISDDGSKAFGIVPTSVVTDTRTKVTTTSYFTGHNPSINAQLYNEFATAAMRYGHTVVSNAYPRFKTDNTEYPGSVLAFADINFKSGQAYNFTNGGVDSIVSGLINSRSGKYDPNFADDLRNKLMDAPNSTFIDLAAFNINRGRDHGLRPWVDYLAKITGTTIATWAQLDAIATAGFITSTASKSLQAVYADVRDIDLFVGGLFERAQGKADEITGVSFSTLLGQQFKELKEGDRFYYENAPNAAHGTLTSAFTLDQLIEIKKMTFSTMLCNSGIVTSVQHDVFFVAAAAGVRPGNTKLACNTYPQMDLSKFIY